MDSGRKYMLVSLMCGKFYYKFSSCTKTENSAKRKDITPVLPFHLFIIACIIWYTFEHPQQEYSTYSINTVAFSGVLWLNLTLGLHKS